MDATHLFVSLFLVITHSVLTKQAEGFATHKLCCDPYQLLLSAEQKCVELTLSDTSQDVLESYEVDWKDPIFDCPDDSKRFHFTTTQLLIGSIKEPLFNQTISQDDYCIQPSTQFGLHAILFCRQPIEIRKCCPFGQFVNRSSVTQCITNDERSAEFPLTRFVDPNYDEDSILVHENSSLHCDFDYNIYLPGYYNDHRFQVSNELGLYVRKAAYGPIRQSKDYCVDSTIYANGTEDVSLLSVNSMSFLI